MSLSLVLGPAHAGKVALLLERTLERMDHDPWLLVPTRPDIERAQREIIARRGGLLAGTIGTFDTLFAHLAYGDGRGQRLLGEAERAVLVRRAAAHEGGNSHPSARFAGYAETLAGTLAELDAGLLEAEHLEEPLAGHVRAYRAALDAIAAWDDGALRRRAVERLRADLGAWGAAPVLAYGFEDLTGAEWALLEALSARTEVHLSIPYEPGRAAYASLSRTVEDLAALAGGAITELAPASSQHLPSAIAHLERALFTDDPVRAPLDGSIRFLEGAGERGTLEFVAEQVLGLVRDGTPAEEIALVCPSVEPLRSTLETAFGASGVPLAIESRAPLDSTAFGASLLALLRFAWSGGPRSTLYAHLRSPYSGVARADVDSIEGRLRGRAIRTGLRALEVTTELRSELHSGRPLPTVELVRAGEEPVATVRALAAAMLRHAYGTESPPVTSTARRDLAAHDAVTRPLDELDALAGTGAAIARSDVLAALGRATVRGDAAGSPGRVAVLDLGRARTRRFAVVFVLGLEQGTLPRRGRPSAFLADDLRRELDERHAGRLTRPDQASRDRYLFLTACTRARERVVLVRAAVGEDGVGRETSPFWEAVRDLFDPEDVRRATMRRPLSALTWELEAAPTERERLRALVRIASASRASATALALANGWDRRFARAVGAFERPTGVTSEAALRVLSSRDRFAVSALERMNDCSAAWFAEKFLNPGIIDKEIDRMMRGSILHQALKNFYDRLPSAIPGAERVTPDNLDDAARLMRECVCGAIASGLTIDATDLERRELERGLLRDLERFVEEEAVAASPFLPRFVERSFKLDLGEGVVVSGKIDRVDVDPLSASGIVVDYKSGAAIAASKILAGDKLQIPLYLLVVRDQIGLEPMGGVYFSTDSGDRRGLLRSGDDRVPGFAENDYVDPDAFAEALDVARDTAIELVGRIRAGDVRHDPPDGKCPDWCDLWRICRKPRP